ADGAGNPVDHGFAKITRPGLRYFGFAHDIESMLNRNHMSSRLHSASTRQGGEEPVFAKATPRQGVEGFFVFLRQIIRVHPRSSAVKVLRLLCFFRLRRTTARQVAAKKISVISEIRSF